MKRHIKSLICIILSIAMSVCCSGCKKEEASSDEYLDLMNSPSTTLNNIWYNTGGIFRCALFDALVATEADMLTIKPAIAKDYIIADDGLKYDFILRDDVIWHDGEKLDAEDVVFSIKTMLRTTEVNGLLSSAFRYIEGAEAYIEQEAEVITGLRTEGNRISIKLVSPAASFLDATAQLAILPEHLLGDVAPDEIEADDYWKKPVGCGPYKITEATDEYFILERNKDYYGAEPGVEKIKLKINVEDPVLAMQEGILDFYVTNDPEEIARLNGAESCSSHRLNILFPAYLIFNLSNDEGANEDLKDVRVRKALLMAIDRKSIVDVIFPSSTVSDTMIPAWDSRYSDDEGEYEFNPERAKALMEEAGFDFDKTIRLRYFTKGQSTADLMSAIAVYWRAIGVKVSLELFEGSGSTHMFQTRDYDVCYKRLSAFNHAAIYEEMAGDGVMQESIYNMPIYDRLISTLATTIGDENRKEIIKEMQKLDREQLLRLPLFTLATVAYVNEARFEMPEAYGNLWYRYDLHFEDWRIVD